MTFSSPDRMRVYVSPAAMLIKLRSARFNPVAHIEKWQGDLLHDLLSMESVFPSHVEKRSRNGRNNVIKNGGIIAAQSEASKRDFSSQNPCRSRMS